MTTETLCVHGSDRATAYEGMNKVVRYENKTHVTYLKFEGGSHIVVVRTYNHDAKEWSPEYLNDPVYDNHCSATIGVDSEGYLHIAYGKHGGGGTFKYRRSVNPNDASVWQSYVIVGTEQMTYPSMAIDSEDTLHLVYRSGGVDSLYYRNKPKGENFNPYTILISASGYVMSYTSSLIIDKNDVIHVCAHFYAGGGKKAGYMRSDDKGNSWRRSDGVAYSLPVGYGTIETIELGGDLRTSNIYFDDENRPMFLVLRLHNSPVDAQFWRHNGEKWVGTVISVPEKDIGQSSMVISYKGVIYIFIVGCDVGAPYADGSYELYMFPSTDKGETFTFEQISETDRLVPNWLPNAERKVGANTLSDVRLLSSGGAISGSVKVNFTYGIVEGVPLRAVLAPTQVAIILLIMVTVAVVAFWKRREIIAYLKRWRYGV